MQFTDPLTLTYRLLATTSHARAVDVLARALDEGDDAVRSLAAAALVERRERTAHVELVRRFERLDEKGRAIAARQALRLSAAAADCLSDADPAVRRSGLQFIRGTERYELLPAVVDLLNQSEDDELPRAVFVELIDRLEAHCTAHREPRPPAYLRNAGQIRHDVLTHLDRVCTRFGELRCPELIVEAVLILGDHDNFAVAKVLSHAGHECRELAGRLLLSSRHPAILELITGLLSKSQPLPKALKAVEEREDPEFVTHLLSWLPEELTEIHRRNLGRIGRLRWLRPERFSDEFPPPRLQAALVRLLSVVGISEADRLRAQEWIIRHGTPGARLAAAERLPAQGAGEVEKIVVGSLDSGDETIQAWATGQLRTHGVGAAFALLLERLDSPLAAVRDAARRELAGFNLERILRLFDQLDPAVCRRAAELLRKIHPDCGDRLAVELRHPVLARRIRAIRAAAALGLQQDVLPELLRLAGDADAGVRRAAGEVLAGLDGPQVAETLERLLADDDGRVRRAVVEALAQRRARAAPGAATPAAAGTGTVPR